MVKYFFSVFLPFYCDQLQFLLAIMLIEPAMLVITQVLVVVVIARMAVLIRMMMLLMILMYHDDINATDDKCNGNSSTRDNIDVTYDFDCNGN